MTGLPLPPIPLSGKIKFDDFCDALPRIAVARFAPSEETPAHEAFRTLLCQHILPHAFRRRLDPGIRELASDGVRAVFRKYNVPLRKVCVVCVCCFFSLCFFASFSVID